MASFLAGDEPAVSLLLSSVLVFIVMVELDPKLTDDRPRLIPVNAAPSVPCFFGGCCGGGCRALRPSMMVICAIDISLSTGTSMDDSTRNGGAFPDDDDFDCGADDGTAFFLVPATPTLLVLLLLLLQQVRSSLKWVC